LSQTLLPTNNTSNPPANTPTSTSTPTAKPVPRRTTYPLSRDVAGNAFWKTIHSAAYSYPENPTQTDADQFRTTFIYLMKSFPCEECKQHARNYLQEYPPPLDNRKNLVMYFCNFHNYVNKKLGKEEEDCTFAVETSKPCESCAVKPQNENIHSQNAGEYPQNKTEGIKPQQTPMKDLTQTFKSYKSISKRVVEELCAKDKIPIPQIVFRECPTDSSTSCTDFYRDPETKSAITKPIIYLNPYQFSPRTIVHEYEHYRRTFLDDDESMFDEHGVEQVARDIIAKEFPLDKMPLLERAANPNVIMTDQELAIAGEGQPIVVVQEREPAPPQPRKLSVMQRYQLIKEARRRKYKVKKQTPPESEGEQVQVVQAVPSASMESAIAPVPPGGVVSAEHQNHFPTYMMIKQRFEAEKFVESQDGDDKDGFFSGFDRLYEPISGHLGLPARVLNESFTSSFIASSVTTIAKTNMSPIGSLLLTSTLGTGMLLSNLALKNHGGVALGDRRMLTDVSTNLMMNALNYANPKVSKKIMKDAKKLGGHLAKMEFDKILPMLIESPFLKKSKYGWRDQRRSGKRRGGGSGGSGSSSGGGGGGGDPAGGGVGGGLSAPIGSAGSFANDIGQPVSSTNMSSIPGAGVVTTGGGSMYSPTIVPGNPSISSQFNPGVPGGFMAPGQARFDDEEGDGDGPGFSAGGGPSFGPQGLPSHVSPFDLDNMTFQQRLRFFEHARGLGGSDMGKYSRFQPATDRRGSDYGQVTPRRPNIYEDEEVYGSPNIVHDSEDGLPAELNPNYPYISEDEEELFGGEARADLHGVRRNSMNSMYYDDLSDLV
jgi:Erv1 / Alr family